MAFDTADERAAMLNLLGMPVPMAMPVAVGGFTLETSALMLYMFPADLPTAAVVIPDDGSVSSSQITRLRLMGVIGR